jgi:hypothetical protein
MSPSTRSGRAAAIVVGACALAAGLAPAQPAPPRQPDPLDARAPVPPTLHVSPLARYRAPGEVAVGSWKDANDTVARLGGWRAYAREAQAPAPAASAASSATPAPARPAPDQGHGHGKH